MNDFPFLYTPPGGGGGSKWYAPSGTPDPVTLPVASGTDALAAGDGARATGGYSIAFGYNAYAPAGWGVAIGYGATMGAFSDGSVIIGYGANTNKVAVVAIGQSAKGTGDNTTAIGSGSQALNNFDVAVGCNTTAVGGRAISIGFNTGAVGGGVALGDTAFGGNPYGIAIGSGAQTAGGQQVAIGGTATVRMRGVSVGDSCTSSANKGGIVIGWGSTVAHDNAMVTGTDGRSYNRNERSHTSLEGPGAFSFNVQGRELNPLFHLNTTTGAATNFDGIAIPDNASAAFHGDVSAFRVAGAGIIGDSAMWKVDGLVKQVGGVYTLIGATVGAAGAPNYNDVGAGGWTLALAIVGNLLTFTATGQAGETISWQSNLKLTVTA